ncbi:MAG: aminotransferase class V-fold PLP-dependent enzyme [Gemmatimonadota bacterium]|nr:MAG: aminotransferase class V-fold PLP-dependent enzyme [Gemmatimonadota bacterium]
MRRMDLSALRGDTPGCEHCIHLNNAGAGLMPKSVIAATRDHLELESRVGGYEAADQRAAEISQVYRSIGDLIGAPARNIAVVENATAGFIQALSSIPWKPGDVLVTTRNDYASSQIQYLSMAARLGIEVVRANDHPDGGVDLVHMEELIHRRRPALVALTHVPTNSGLVQQAAAVGHLCRAKNVPYLLDACQSVGQMPIDVDELQCDFLSATARKFLRGPRGIGFLYVSDRALDAGLEPLFIDMQGADWIADDLYQPSPDARRFENWEFAYALVLGLGEAARYAQAVGLESARDRARALAQRARAELSELPRVTVQDRGRDLCAIATVSVEGWTPADLSARLGEGGINTSISTRMYAVLDFDAKGVEGALRISPHYYNTDEEIDMLVSALAEVLASPGTS